MGFLQSNRPVRCGRMLSEAVPSKVISVSCKTSPRACCVTTCGSSSGIIESAKLLGGQRGFEPWVGRSIDRSDRRGSPCRVSEKGCARRANPPIVFQGAIEYTISSDNVFLTDWVMMVSQKRAAIYAQVSTVDKGQDPETQMMALRDYAERRGFEIVGEYIDYASAPKRIGQGIGRCWKRPASGNSILSWSGVTTGLPAPHKC